MGVDGVGAAAGVGRRQHVAPPRSAAVAAPCDSAETVAALCGPGASRFVKVVVNVNARQSSIHGSVDPGPSSPAADPYLVSGVVDAASRHLEELCMDHMLWTSERDGVMTLECVASAPGLVVDTQQTARALRQAIGRAFAGRPWTNDNIQHVSVTSSTEEAFQQARADLADQVRADSTFHLEVCCGVAARAVLNCRARGARQSARGRRGRIWVQADHDVAPADPALHGAAPASQRPPPDEASFAGVVAAGRITTSRRVQADHDVAPADPALHGAAPASQRPPPDAASFARVVAAGLPHFALSAFAAAASEKHAEIKASLQPPLERDGVLAVARACLVLLEAVIPKLARLAHFADTLSGLSQRAGASGADSAELRAAIEEARLALHRADETGVDIGRPRCRRRRRSSGSAPTPVRRRKRRSSGPAPAPPTTASVIKALVEAVRLNEPATQSAQAQSGRLFSRAAEGAFEPAEEGGGGRTVECSPRTRGPGHLIMVVGSSECVEGESRR